jgi:hypothetical protein
MGMQAVVIYRSDLLPSCNFHWVLNMQNSGVSVPVGKGPGILLLRNSGRRSSFRKDVAGMMWS